MLIDPFGSKDETAPYVSRPAAEEALPGPGRAPAESRLVGPVGPPGIGKSLLLKLMERRLARHAVCVRIEYNRFGSEELWSWVLHELDSRGLFSMERVGENAPRLEKLRGWLGQSPEEPDLSPTEVAMLAQAQELRMRGWRLVLLIDDADALRLDVAERIAELVTRAQGSLAVALAFTTEGELPDVCGPLGRALTIVRYDAPLSPSEALTYLRERLDRAGASRELRACISEERIADLMKRTSGMPRALHGEIALLHLRLSSVRTGDTQDLGRPSYNEPEPVLGEPEHDMTPLATPEVQTLPDLEGDEYGEVDDTRDRGGRRGLRRVVMGLSFATALGLGIWFGAAGYEERLAALPAVSSSADESCDAALEPAGQAASEPVAPAIPQRALPVISTNINATPWATIAIDGIEIGETPLGDIRLEEGVHTFKALMADGRVFTKTVRVTEENARIVFP